MLSITTGTRIMNYAQLKAYSRLIIIVAILTGSGFSSLAQDKLKKTNGPVLEVKVNEISSDEVIYHTYTNLSGPIYRLKLNQLDWIKINGDPDTTFYNKKPFVKAEPAVASPNITPTNEVTPATPNTPKAETKTKVVTQSKLESPKTKADSARSYRHYYTKELVMIPEDREPLFKEVIYTIGGGTTAAGGDGHPLGNFGGSRSGNFYKDGGSLFAGLGGFFEFGIITRFSKNWGATANFVTTTNGVNPDNLANSDYRSPLPLPDGNNGTPISGRLNNVSFSSGNNSTFISGGPVYFLNVTRKSDIMFHAGFGLGSVRVPEFELTYVDQIPTGRPVGPTTHYIERYEVARQDNYFNSFAYSLNVRIKSYITNRVYLLGKVGYENQVVNIYYRRTDNIIGSSPKNYESIHSINNFVLGAAIGFGL